MLYLDAIHLTVNQRDGANRSFLCSWIDSGRAPWQAVDNVPRVGDEVELLFVDSDPTLAPIVDRVVWNWTTGNLFSRFTLWLNFTCEELTRRQLVFLTTAPWGDL